MKKIYENAKKMYLRYSPTEYWLKKYKYTFVKEAVACIYFSIYITDKNQTRHDDIKEATYNSPVLMMPSLWV